MLKINLLNSVTERQEGAVASVDKTIASPVSKLLVMSLAVGFLTFAAIAWEIVGTHMAKADAEAQLQEQKQIAAELETVMNEQKDLETRIQNIDKRIEAIKTLRASQAGPSAVLDSVRERIAMTPGIYLESVEQSGDKLIFKGSSPDENQVTQLGRSLEFSNGLFKNLNIEITRNEITPQNAVVKEGTEAPKVSVINFTIKCDYAPTQAAGANNGVQQASAGQPAAPSAPGQAPPPQVAKTN